MARWAPVVQTCSAARRAAAAWVAWFLQHPRLESSLASPAEIHKLVNIDLEGNVQTESHRVRQPDQVAAAP